MKEKKLLKETFPIKYYSLTEESKEMDREDRDLYLFLRGGLTAK